MLCGWESNRRSGVALAVCHILQWLIHLRAHGLRKEDEHPAYTLLMWYDILYLTLLNQGTVVRGGGASV